ncbi:DedA family protein [Mesorhizobium sp. NBSH29]|uniref:DedA family protein n=1 Tax=Mesorhizobium sp. NBSH29 TaxID=2654249 RepID=UPI0018969FC0|nr:DedA family protein [Mesorhizobium sp. NBSH29]QPC87971.1 DedA family protein [Mesorhizobium sp. NBSH29]
MTDTIHLLVAKYGLLAIFVGCLAEGESVVILGGFFAHQRVFVPWQAFAVAFSGAFIGDAALFFLGRRFSSHAFVERMRQKPGFSHAHRLVNAYPNSFVFFNRYAYGMRTVAAITAGLSGISIPRFLVLNALSALVWVTLFGSLGYVGGMGAEKLLGEALAEHQRLIVALVAAVAITATAWYAAHHFFRKGKKNG